MINDISVDLTCDTGHLACDTWHVSRDTKGISRLLKKLKVPSTNGLGECCFEDWEEKSHKLNESVTKLYVEQPGLHQVC